jgi:osmotically-inducible protein OsmY
VVAELARQPWAPLALIDIIVKNGVVDLWGTITDERVRQAIIVLAENVSGVKQVNDHLAWVDATSGMVLFRSNEEPVQVKAS